MGVIRKSNPVAGDVHQDQVLTNLSIAYMQSHPELDIVTQVFPMVPVDKRSDKYLKYNKNDFFQNLAKKRADGQESAGSGYGLSDDTYYCDVWAFHKDIGDQTMANYDNPLNPKRDANEFVTQILLISRAKKFVDTYFKAGVWANDKKGGATAGGEIDFVHWDDFGNGDPIKNIRDYKRAIKGITGFMPNGLLIGGEVWDKLQDHPDIIERIKYVKETTNITPKLVANIFGLDRIIIAEGIYATNEPGAEVESYAQIFGKAGLLFYAPSRPSLMQPSAGYNFGWAGYAKNIYGISIDSFYKRSIKSTRIEGELAYGLKVVCNDMGLFMDNLVS